MRWVIIFLLTLNFNTILHAQISTFNEIIFGEDWTHFGLLPILADRDTSRSQIIYYPDELQFRGEINEIRFFSHFSNPPISNSDEWIVKFGLTDLEEFGPESSFILDSELTTVFQGEVGLANGTAREIAVKLDVPFYYDGQKNLVIDIREVEPGEDESALNTFEGVRNFSTPPIRSMIEFFDFGENVILRENSYPTTKFIGDFEKCLTPENYAIDNITTTSASITLSNNDGIDLYRYNLSVDDEEIPDTYETTGNLLNLTDLLAAQNYHINVKSDCDIPNLGWISKHFITKPLALTVPSEIDFEAFNRNYLLSHEIDANTFITELPASIGSGQGLQFQGKLEYPVNWNDQEDIFTANLDLSSKIDMNIDLSNASKPVFSFDLRQKSQSYLRVLINNVPLSQIYTSSSSDEDFFRTITIDLSEYANENIELTIQHVGRYSGSGLATAYIDNIKLKEDNCSVELILNLGDDLVVCGEETVTLDAGSGFSSYLWNDGSTSQTLASTIAGTFYVTVSNDAGCILTDEITVSRLEAPTIDLGDNIIVCEGETVDLDAGSGFSTYNWNNGMNTQSISVNSSGTYSVKVTNDLGCATTDEITVTFQQNPIIDLDDNIIACEGEILVLDAGAGFSTYLWSDGSDGQTISISEPGTYSVTVSNEQECTSSKEIQVTFAQNPTVNLGEDLTVTDSEVITLDAGAGFTNYSWSTNETSQTIQVENSGIYTVEVTDENGCTDFDEIEVTFQLPTSIQDLKQKIIYYPNPVKNKLFLKHFTAKNTIKVSVNSLQDRRLFYSETKSTHDDTIEIDLSELDKGLYILIINDDTHLKIYKQ